MVYANKIRDGIYKDLVIKKISNEYGLPEGKLLKYDATNTANQTRAFKKLKKQKSQIKRPSLINQAIRILLNKPELAKSIDISNKFKFIDEKGFDIFREIIQLINKKEQIKLATIIEHFPEPKLQKYLTKIAMEKNLINENEWSIEFDDIIKTLERQDQRKELKKLIEKAKNDPLNNDDDTRLKELSRKIK